MWTVELTVMAAMIAVNGVFAAYEIALASVGLVHLELLAREHRGGAAAAHRMKGKIEASLAVVQLGITLVGATAAATGGAGAEEKIQPLLLGLGFRSGVAQFLAIAIVVVPLTILTIIFGELVPKVFALRNKEWVCLKLSPLMEWFSYCVWPAVWLLETAVMLIMHFGERRWRPGRDFGPSEEAAMQELRAVAAMARTSRLIGLREEGIIVNAARLASLPVHRIMLPAEYISTLNADDPLGAALLAAHYDMHTRFPVTQRAGDPKSIVGYVNFKDIVACMRVSPREPSLRAIVRPLIRLPADVSVAAALERMIREHQHIALIQDASGTVAGMITLEDIIEELVGEIHDEYDRLPANVSPLGTGWIVGGGATLKQIADAAKIQLPIRNRLEPPPTLNDWVIRQLGRPLERGEILRADGIRVVIRKERRQRVLEAFLTQEPDGDSI